MPDHARLRKLLAEGTKLPWHPQGQTNNGKAVYRVKPADEALICAAVNSLPDLLTEIETLKYQLSKQGA